MALSTSTLATMTETADAAGTKRCHLRMGNGLSINQGFSSPGRLLGNMTGLEPIVKKWTNVRDWSWTATCPMHESGHVLFLLLTALCLATVPLAGGRLSALADLRFRGTRVLIVALAVQVLILAILSDGNPTVLGAVYVATFLTAATFIWLNRRVPGVPLLGLGGALNATAIVANDGVMPARPGALMAAGRPVVEDGFRNSAAVADPQLPWLGDTFAIPSPLPLANVFSVGDVVLVVGMLVLLHVTCGSHLARRPVLRREKGEVMA